MDTIQYEQRGRLTLALVDGQTYVATEANLPVLKAFVEEGKECQLNPGKDNKSGDAWVWVNPLGSKPQSKAPGASGGGFKPRFGGGGGGFQPKPTEPPQWAIDLHKKVDGVLEILGRFEQGA